MKTRNEIKKGIIEYLERNAEKEKIEKKLSRYFYDNLEEEIKQKYVIANCGDYDYEGIEKAEKELFNLLKNAFVKNTRFEILEPTPENVKKYLSLDDIINKKIDMRFLEEQNIVLENGNFLKITYATCLLWKMKENFSLSWIPDIENKNYKTFEIIGDIESLVNEICEENEEQYKDYILTYEGKKEKITIKTYIHKNYYEDTFYKSYSFSNDMIKHVNVSKIKEIQDKLQCFSSKNLSKLEADYKIKKTTFDNVEAEYQIYKPKSCNCIYFIEGEHIFTVRYRKNYVNYYLIDNELFTMGYDCMTENNFLYIHDEDFKKQLWEIINIIKEA